MQPKQTKDEHIRKEKRKQIKDENDLKRKKKKHARKMKRDWEVPKELDGPKLEFNPWTFDFDRNGFNHVFSNENTWIKPISTSNPQKGTLI